MRKIFFTLALLTTIALRAQEDSVIVERTDTFTLDSIRSEVVEHTKAGADSAYIKGDFQQAIQIYEELLVNGESAEVYYNLGNAYYKAGDIARAILNYERALLLEPGNGDIRANLELARAKTVDKVEPTPEIFFVSWGKSLINTMSSDAWAYVSVVAFILLICAVIAFAISSNVGLKKTGFFGGIVMLVVVILANIFAAQQKSELENRNDAIVITPSVSVRSTPDESGTALFVLHEGHKVEIKDASMKSWKEIRLEDGKVGWIPDSAIEII
jgi:tetratricopeptide (TPR) repeat protein